MNKIRIKNKQFKGFTIIELLVVIIVIGILAAITVISYSGIQTRMRDKSIESDANGINASELNYINNNYMGKAWYSSNGVDTDLDFTPSEGNVIDVVVDGSDYCIRVYNPKGTKNSIINAFTKESKLDACNSIDPSTQALATISPKVWLQISGGVDNTCGIASDKQAYCWGRNNVGEHGNNSTNQSRVPVAVKNNEVGDALYGKTIKSISAGEEHTCAIASDNLAYCWGLNSSGELGDGTTSPRLIPVAVKNNEVGDALYGKTIKSISAGDGHTCAIASDNLAYCWGSDSWGRLGNNSSGDSLVPGAVYIGGVLSGKTIKSISTNYSHSCVIASDNQVYCWGDGGNGRLGNNSTITQQAPVAIVDNNSVFIGKTIKSVSAGHYHTCAIASDNQAYCWGYDQYGQLGNNSTETNYLFPVAVKNNVVGDALYGKTVKSISAGYLHTCAIASDDKVYCWGYNDPLYGCLGNNTYDNSSVPTAVYTGGVLGGKTIKSMSSKIMSMNGFVIDSDYKAYGWGFNGYGQLGNDSITTVNTPVIVNSAP